MLLFCVRKFFNEALRPLELLSWTPTFTVLPEIWPEIYV